MPEWIQTVISVNPNFIDFHQCGMWCFAIAGLHVALSRHPSNSDVVCGVNCLEVASGSLHASGSSKRFTGATPPCSRPVQRKSSAPRKNLLGITLRIYHVQRYNESSGTAYSGFSAR